MNIFCETVESSVATSKCARQRGGQRDTGEGWWVTTLLGLYADFYFQVKWGFWTPVLWSDWPFNGSLCYVDNRLQRRIEAGMGYQLRDGWEAKEGPWWLRLQYQKPRRFFITYLAAELDLTWTFLVIKLNWDSRVFNTFTVAIIHFSIENLMYFVAALVFDGGVIHVYYIICTYYYFHIPSPQILIFKTWLNPRFLFK